MHQEAIERRLKRAYEWLAEYCKYRLQPHPIGMSRVFEERKQKVFDKGHDAIFAEIKKMVKCIEDVDYFEKEEKLIMEQNTKEWQEIYEMAKRFGFIDDDK